MNIKGFMACWKKEYVYITMSLLLNIGNCWIVYKTKHWSDEKVICVLRHQKVWEHPVYCNKFLHRFVLSFNNVKMIYFLIWNTHFHDLQVRTHSITHNCRLIPATHRQSKSSLLRLNAHNTQIGLHTLTEATKMCAADVWESCRLVLCCLRPVCGTTQLAFFSSPASLTHICQVMRR